MSESTNISWADSTASPWFGCTEVSPGCANCYARELTLKRKWAGWGDDAARVRSKGFWKDIPKWNRKAADDLAEWHMHSDLHGGDARYDKPQRPRIFPSLMDWLDPMVPVQWLADLLKIIHDTPNLDWLLLTKRPELFQSRLMGCMKIKGNADIFTWPMMVAAWLGLEGIIQEPPPNVWFGVTVEDQKRADERIPELLKIPARVRWLSVEPLLEVVNLEMALQEFQPLNADLTRKPAPAQWVVVGGESGSKRRDCGVAAICDLAAQCVGAHVPVWVKQDCAHKPGQQGRIPNSVWNLKQLPETVAS